MERGEEMITRRGFFGLIGGALAMESIVGKHVWIAVGEDCWCKNCGIPSEESVSLECSKNVLQMDKGIMNTIRDALDGIQATPKAVGQMYRILSKEKLKGGNRK